MSSHSSPDPGLRGNRLTLTALTALTSCARPYEALSPIRRPELKSDLKHKTLESCRGSNETTWSAVSSFFSRTQSGISSAGTSPVTSENLDGLLKRDHIPTIPIVSRFSIATIDVTESTEIDHFVTRGAVYSLVKASAKVGTLRGAVDIFRKKVLHEKWSKRIWNIIDYPENFVEAYEEEQRKEKIREIIPPDPATLILQKLLVTPASNLSVVDKTSSFKVSEATPPSPASGRPAADETSSLEIPEAVPPSPKCPKSGSASSISSAANSCSAAFRVFWSCATASLHTVPSRSRQHSVSNFSENVVSQNPLATMQSIDSIDSRIGNEIDPALRSVSDSGTEGESFTTAASDTLNEISLSSGNSLKITTFDPQRPINAPSDHGSTVENSAIFKHEGFRTDVKIFHPVSTAAIITYTLFDSQSSDSHISPKALEQLQIPLDSELIQPSTYEYFTNEGPAIAERGYITLDFRFFSDPSTSYRHEKNKFFIASDNAPYDGILLGTDFLLPSYGRARMKLCLINVTDPKTAKTKEERKKAKEAAENRAKENERLKMELRAAARQKADSSSKSKKSERK